MPRALCGLLIGARARRVRRDLPEPHAQPARQPRHHRLHPGRVGRRRARDRRVRRGHLRGRRRRGRRRRRDRARRLRARHPRRRAGLPADPRRHRRRRDADRGHRLPASRARRSRRRSRPTCGSPARSTAAAGSTCGRSRRRCSCSPRSSPLLGRELRMLELGDEAARALGVGIARSRLALVLRGRRAERGRHRVGRPDRVRRARRAADRAPAHARERSRASPAPRSRARCCCSAADCASQRIPGDVELPVGVLTGVLGGVYLSWLLVREWRA